MSLCLFKISFFARDTILSTICFRRGSPPAACAEAHDAKVGCRSLCSAVRAAMFAIRCCCRVFFFGGAGLAPYFSVCHAVPQSLLLDRSAGYQRALCASAYTQEDGVEGNSSRRGRKSGCAQKFCFMSSAVARRFAPLLPVTPRHVGRWCACCLGACNAVLHRDVLRRFCRMRASATVIGVLPADEMLAR